MTFYCYNKKYILTLSETIKSDFLSSIADKEDIYLDQLCPRIFNRENKKYWEWIYNELKIERKIFPFIYDYDEILKIIPFVNFLSIQYIIINIAYTINNGIFTLYDIISHYDIISNNNFLDVIIQLLLIKKLLSLKNIVNYFDLIKFSNNYIVDKIAKTLEFLSSNTLDINFKYQNEIINKCDNNFLLLSKLENINIRFIPEIYRKFNTWDNFFNKYNIKTFKDIITKDYFDDDDEEWNHSIYGFKVIVIDFKSFFDLDFFSFFNSDTLIYEFYDPFTLEKYFIFANTLFCGDKNLYLSFEEDNNYPFPSSNMVKSDKLNPIFKISDLSNKNYFFNGGSDIIFTYENNNKCNNSNNEYIYENIFRILKT